MGNFLNYKFAGLKLIKDCDTQLCVQVECEDFKKVKEIWLAVEKDTSHYGFAICTIFFKNHPQYVKYFEDESIPEFVQEAIIKKKFITICDIICALFINYYDKPSRRDYFLGYIAMVHKDMGLTFKDLANFMSDLMEALITELPYLMTEEYIATQTKYSNNVIEIMVELMDNYVERMSQILRTRNGIRKCYVCKPDPESQIVYGFPLKYWIYGKRYWEYRKAMWASMEADMLTNSTDDTNASNFQRKGFHHKKQIKPKTPKIAISSDSNTLLDQPRQRRRSSRISQSTRISLLLSKRNKERQETEKNVKSKFSPMEFILEVESDRDGNNDPINLNGATTQNPKQFSAELQESKYILYIHTYILIFYFYI
ncbi:uncharacterized protein LOC117153680 [Bombus vancouverensis nearcticus]|uniref:uncharacterized protein LOC117153680 n=1 Tax=Bombus vancouverensis nearcticus TaxID=2705178 RepID=UPI00402BA99F